MCADWPSTIGFCQHIVTNKVTLWAASHSACVVYTKTIIHLSVGESHVYLFTSTSVDTVKNFIFKHSAYDMKNIFCLFERPFKIQKNGVYLFSF